MKKLILLNGNTDIKLNDTGTIIQFKAQNDGQPVSISNGQTATFRIKNDFGFVKSVKASSSYGGYVFELDTADLSGLVVGSYQVELLIQKDADDALIFPDTAFVGFNITANALTITGEQLPMMSLDEFKNELKTYVDNQTISAETAIKNDFQTYVDGLSDSTIATATKASQDATTAVNTANTAKSTAESAVQTANGASSKANANASLITTLNSTVSNFSQGARNLLRQSETLPNNLYNGIGTTQDYKLMNAIVFEQHKIWNGFLVNIKDLYDRNLINTFDDYVFSFYIKVDDNTHKLSNYSYFNNNNAFSNYTEIVNAWNTQSLLRASNEWIQIQFPLKFASNTLSQNSFVGVWFSQSYTYGNVYWSCPKIEKGTKATDYTPAPEDLEAQIASLQQAQSTLLTKMAMIDANSNEGSGS